MSDEPERIDSDVLRQRTERFLRRGQEKFMDAACKALHEIARMGPIKRMLFAKRVAKRALES